MLPFRNPHFSGSLGCCMLSLRLGSLGHTLGEPPPSNSTYKGYRDNGDYTRILLQSYCITSTGWGGLHKTFYSSLESSGFWAGSLEDRKAAGDCWHRFNRDAKLGADFLLSELGKGICMAYCHELPMLNAGALGSGLGFGV